ncbi:hypothetical protein ACLOJK_041281 [Asimina triloba]
MVSKKIGTKLQGKSTLYLDDSMSRTIRPHRIQNYGCQILQEQVAAAIFVTSNANSDKIHC